MSEDNSIGETLRSARERMGLGVVQAAERLHVDAEVIDALETGRFKALGAPVFVRGHLRRYAELLGEPDGPLQQRYASTTEASLSPDLTQVPHRPTPVVPTNPRRWPLVMLAIVLVLAAVVWWAMRIRTA
jgi:cytoskeleton protein RodZ